MDKYHRVNGIVDKGFNEDEEDGLYDSDESVIPNAKN